MKSPLILDYQGLGGLDTSGTIQLSVPITKPGVVVLEPLLTKCRRDLYTRMLPAFIALYSTL
jgi:hypothetical protein